MKYQLIIFLYISLFPKYILAQRPKVDQESFKQYCNIQIPDNKSICNDLEYPKENASDITDGSNPILYKACCFERFRINKILVTRCSYIEFSEDGINEEKKKLRDLWGVKNLTILCSGGNLKFKFLFFLILEFLIFII